MQKALTIILFFVFATCSSQVAKEDFAKINKTYDKSSHFSVNMKYEVFKNKTTKVPLQVETGKIMKNGKATHTVIGKLETVQNENYSVVVDHDDKNIALMGNELGRQTDSDEKLYLVNLEKLLKLCTKVEFKSESASQNSYLLEIPSSEFTVVKIFFNTKSFFIEKMQLYYREAQNLEEKEGGLKEQPRLEVTYSDLNMNPTFSDADFTYEKFLTKKGDGKFQGLAPYANYTVTQDLMKN